MDFFKNAKKFLNELDEPQEITAERPVSPVVNRSLEAHLERASSRVLSWASSGVDAAGGPNRPVETLGADEEAADDSSQTSGDEAPQLADPPELAEPAVETAEALEAQEAGSPRESMPPAAPTDAAVSSHEGDAEAIAPEAALQSVSELSVAEPTTPPLLEDVPSLAAAAHESDAPHTTTAAAEAVVSASETVMLQHATEIAAPSDPLTPPVTENIGDAAVVENAEPVAASVTANGNCRSDDVARLEAQLEDAQERLRQLEAQLSLMAEQLDEREAAAQATGADRAAQLSAQSAAQLAQARREAEKEMKILRKQLKSAEAARDAAQRSSDDWKEQATSAERRLKEEVNDTERELKEHQDAWRRKILDAERRAEEAAKHGEEETGIVMHELQEGREEILHLRQLLAAQEEELGKLRTDATRFTELLRVATETESQLRRESFELERARAQLQEQHADVCDQLQHAQAAYDTAGQEMSLMASRLHELEFGQQTSSGTEDFLRQQHAVAKERCKALELRLSDDASARDFAMQQADELRRQFSAAKEELSRLQAEGNARKSEDGDARAAKAEAELDRMRIEMQQLSQHHGQELQRQSQSSRDEVEYLKRKNDEKDRRLEQLTCERNMLRVSNATGPTAEKEKPSSPAAVGRGRRADSEFLPDLEDGRGTSATATATNACVTDTDRFLRKFSRVLYLSSTVRRLFYGYLLLLHFWGWFVMHRAAILHHPHHA
jgi:hypothetical protein